MGDDDADISEITEGRLFLGSKGPAADLAAHFAHEQEEAEWARLAADSLAARPPGSLSAHVQDILRANGRAPMPTGGLTAHFAQARPPAAPERTETEETEVLTPKARGKRPLSLISAAVDGAASPTTPKRAAPAATPERAPGAAAADRGGDYATMQSLLRTMRFVRE